jgi:MraZ protein
MSFRGTYEHTVDDRGRVAIPARYRHEFAEGVVLTLGEEGCIEVFTTSGFAEMSDLVAAEPATTAEGRRSRRRFDAQSWDTELDRQGRILIPAKFREAASLDGPVVIAGRRECLEIWSPKRWERELREATAGSSRGPESRG